MRKSDKLNKAKMLLSKALQALPETNNISETKNHVKRAIDSVDKQIKKEGKKTTQTRTNHENWWSDIESGVANMAASPMTKQTQMKALSALEQMIGQTKSELDELEKEKKKPQKTEIPDLFLQE